MSVTTSLQFRVFQQAVAEKFAQMRQTPLFRARVDRDELWRIYLASFPAGTNPIFRERTEHDCSCCRHFIKAAGGMVTVKDGQRTTLWGSLDIEEGHPYRIVADALDAYVRSCPIENVFLHDETTVGEVANLELIDGHTLTFEHFYLVLPPTAVCKKAHRQTTLGEWRTAHDVFVRGLTEITTEAIDTVSDLIRQNSLYRGEEHQAMVNSIAQAKTTFDRCPEALRDDSTWEYLRSIPQEFARVRNTVIGTLLCDLSAGMDLEGAVKSFEQKVAPTNYRRPTALVTPKMIAAAKEELNRLGLLSALERRYATREDLTVNNVLFVDRATKKHLKGSVLDTLVPNKPVSHSTFDKIESVTIEKFIADIVPSAQSIEVLVENRHASNFVSLIGPAHDDAPLLFTWPNRFSWCYAGDLADSIKARVKQAGGNVTGDLRCSLSWSNYDDLDLHLREHSSHHEIYYANRNFMSPNGGMLDVDMNAGLGITRTPVENICYADRKTMRDGRYSLMVHQFAKRETRDVGFVVEIEVDGTVHTFNYPLAVKHNERVDVADIRYRRETGFTIEPLIPSEVMTRRVWNIQTQQFHPLSMLTLSPNRWDGLKSGNTHYFFILDGCRHEGQARGFFNEFLRNDLSRHRKVMEMVGASVRTEESDRQLSGLGFSSTQRNSLVCRVRGSFNRNIRVTF